MTAKKSINSEAYKVKLIDKDSKTRDKAVNKQIF